MSESSTLARAAQPTVGIQHLEKLPRVIARTGHGRSQIYRLVALGQFPAPVKLGERASAWVSTEIDEYIAKRIAERDAKAAA